MFRVCALVAVFLVVSPLSALAATLSVNGTIRSFEMFVPATPPRPLPLVLVLHGGGGTSAQMRRYSAFDRVAKAKNFIVVYPQAIEGHWNDGRTEIANMGSRAADADDVAFLLGIVDILVERGLADPHRVYATGISNGGMMVLRLACTEPGRLAGAAVVATNQPAGLACDPSLPVPMLFFHGTADRFVPFKGGDILQWANIDRGRVISAEATVRQWLRIDGCSGPAKSQIVASRAGGANMRVQKITYEPCEKAPVQRFVCEGGGHSWPGARQSRAGDAVLGPAANGIKASEEIWSFFKTLSR